MKIQANEKKKRNKPKNITWLLFENEELNKICEKFPLQGR